MLFLSIKKLKTSCSILIYVLNIQILTGVGYCLDLRNIGVNKVVLALGQADIYSDSTSFLKKEKAMAQ